MRGHRQALVVVIGIQPRGGAELLELAQALGCARLVLQVSDEGKHQRREHGDDGDDDEEFDECEGGEAASFHFE